MTMRAARRRISPRARNRYRNIKNFFRRALGTSKSDLNINSSIALNVTDLKHKIGGLESQINEVGKQCQDYIGTEYSSDRSESFEPSEYRYDIDTIDEQRETPSGRKYTETKLLYKTSDGRYQIEDSDNASKHIINTHSNKNMTHGSNETIHRTKFERKGKKKSKHYEVSADYDNIDSISSNKTLTYERHSPRERTACHKSRYRKNTENKEEYHKSIPLAEEKQPRHKERHHHKQKDFQYSHKTTDEKLQRRKEKTEEPGVDTDFIEDIIKRQYRPCKMFDRKQSVLSQMSAPVCRDNEFPIIDTLLEGSNLCSCGPEEYDDCDNIISHAENIRCNGKSVCDTRLYGRKKGSRARNRRKYNDYNDSEYYDVIPVKEKSSPKSRKRFVEENMNDLGCFNEVPPSPRTMRPQFNLRTQYVTDYDDQIERDVPKFKLQNTCDKSIDSDVSSEVFVNNRDYREKPIILPKPLRMQNENIHHDIGTASNSQEPISAKTEQTNNDICSNKDKEAKTVDKTDKALTEIKDILQSFLHEIKDSSDQSCSVNKSNIKPLDDLPQILHNFNPNLQCANASYEHNMSHYGMPTPTSQSPPPPPYVPGFTNPCCYPVMPVCPLNYLQGGWLVPNTSQKNCPNCTNNSNNMNTNQNNIESTHKENVEEIANNTKQTNETNELIKEIYKYIADNPKVIREKYETPRKSKCSPRSYYCDSARSRKRMVTRSVGGSTRTSRRDVKVGTKIHCLSKSCEALSSAVSVTSDIINKPSYSETVLDRISLEATGSESSSETSLASDTVIEKVKGNKLGNLLKSLFQKNKKVDNGEELYESDIQTARNSPFPQQMQAYTMHGQEYLQPPPMPHGNPPYGMGMQGMASPYDYYGYLPGPGIDPRIKYPSSPVHPVRGSFSPHKIHNATIHEYNSLPNYPLPSPMHSMPYSTSDPYSKGPYVPVQPKGPVCFKEIEIKSTATQSSDTKPTFFNILRKKVLQPPVKNQIPKGGQFAKQKQKQTKISEKDNWKTVLEKSGWKGAFKDPGMLDPYKFSMLTNNNITAPDNTLKKIVMKKLFQKRNPFSKRNLLVRNLLAENKGPQKIFYPSLF